MHIAGPGDHQDASGARISRALTDAGLNYDKLLAKADFLEQSGMLAINQLLEARQDFTRGVCRQTISPPTERGSPLPAKFRARRIFPWWASMT